MTRESLTTSRSPGPSQRPISREARMLDGARAPVQHEQPRRVARLGRRLRDRVGRQLVVEVVDPEACARSRPDTVTPGRMDPAGRIGQVRLASLRAAC